ncbi:hypothetical protein [Massilia glaciei]|uniref:Uncharacterized protein n=1 Tax=Massilia glaciei TaxID=1524097 RepID=A0A2U2HAW8_9BURK|nr:hypothetical protein [Massilia glaciei]PWF39920.1 hypothetical protein C7C56_026475 [Massilia glaciei]
MYEQPHFTINRSLIVLLPKQAAYDWLMGAGTNPPKLTLAEIRKDPNGFLVSQSKVENLDVAESWVHQRWDLFFTHFLNSWHTDEQHWPQKRSLAMFKEFFEIQSHFKVWDLSDEPIERAEAA